MSALASLCLCALCGSVSLPSSPGKLPTLSCPLITLLSVSIRGSIFFVKVRPKSTLPGSQPTSTSNLAPITLFLSRFANSRIYIIVITKNFWGTERGEKMRKIVVAGRNDSGKSTILGEIYKGLKMKNYQPLAIGSGFQDEKPYLLKGIDSTYLTVAIPEPGHDVISDIDRVVRNAINIIKEQNSLIQHARKALEELNKVRSVLDLGHLTQKDIPTVASIPNVVLIEAVGINDGYKAEESRRLADLLVTIVPAGIKSEIIMDQANILLDEADIVVVTKIDETPRDVSTTTIKLLQRIYRYKPIIPVVATQGVHLELVIEEVLKRLIDPIRLLNMQEEGRPAGEGN